MCKYCATDLNGDPAEDNEDIISEDVGSIGDKPLTASVGVYNGFLSWGLYNSFACYPTVEVKINYCPMCGRRLS